MEIEWKGKEVSIEILSLLGEKNIDPANALTALMRVSAMIICMYDEDSRQKLVDATVKVLPELVKARSKDLDKPGLEHD